MVENCHVDKINNKLGIAEENIRSLKTWQWKYLTLKK